MKYYLFTVLFSCIVGIPIMSLVFYLEEMERKERLFTIFRLVHKVQEESYFEGQKDYMNGDIRISKTNNCYQWIKSPWDTGSVDTNLFKLPCE